MRVSITSTLILIVLFMDQFYLGVCSGQDGRSIVNGISVTGKNNPQLKSFDDMMVRLLREHQIPGASLAVSRNGELVYARGFGVADAKQQVPIQPTTRFRIASISKPITAAAIVLLVQEGKVSLDDTLGSFLNRTELRNVNPDVRRITIRQLLQHRAGWDRSSTYDPMFETVMIGKKLGARRPANQSQIIQFMLSRPLDFAPDTKYAYSNFGYCLLGRIIERVSGQSYGSFVKQKLMKPLNVESMQLGESIKLARNETQYFDRRQRTATGIVEGVYGRKVPLQYGGWCLENMDSHGGWIASAPDLVKFADAFAASGKLLNKESLKSIFQPNKADLAKDVYYGLGWQVRKLKNSGSINSWHTGSLTGTSTILVRRHDGLNWAVLFNMRDGKDGKRMASIVDPLVHAAANRISKWPGSGINRSPK